MCKSRGIHVLVCQVNENSERGYIHEISRSFFPGIKMNRIQNFHALYVSPFGMYTVRENDLLFIKYA